jgi:hypothetical protein
MNDSPGRNLKRYCPHHSLLPSLRASDLAIEHATPFQIDISHGNRVSMVLVSGGSFTHDQEVSKGANVWCCVELRCEFVAREGCEGVHIAFASCRLPFCLLPLCC